VFSSRTLRNSSRPLRSKVFLQHMDTTETAFRLGVMPALGHNSAIEIRSLTNDFKNASGRNDVLPTKNALPASDGRRLGNRSVRRSRRSREPQRLAVNRDSRFCILPPLRVGGSMSLRQLRTIPVYPRKRNRHRASRARGIWEFLSTGHRE
jgi:hypothetical protein